MQKNKWILAFLVFCLWLSTSFSQHAAALERQKATVVLMVINNAKTSYDEELTSKITTWLNQKVNGNYTVVPNQPYVEKLLGLSVADLNQYEKNAIFDVLKNDGIDYVVYMELKPFVVKDQVTVFRYGKRANATVVVKIVDIANGRYHYTGTFSDQAGKDEQAVFIDERIIALFTVQSKSTAFVALDHVLFRAGEAISIHLPLLPQRI